MKHKIDMFLIKKNFKKYFSTNILFCSYVLCSLLMGILLRLVTIGNILSFKAFICDLMIIVLFGAFGYFIKPRNQFKYFFSLCVFFCLICICNTLYYEFYRSFLSFNLISTVSMLGGVKSSVFDKLRFIQFIYIIFPIIIIYINSLLKKRKYYIEVEKIEKGKKMFVNNLIASGILLLLALVTVNGTEASRFIKQWNREYIVQKFGIYTYTINDLIQSLTPQINSWFGYDKASLIFREFYEENDVKEEENAYTNIYEGKNILFIHGESIQNFLIGLEINGKEVTPNLNDFVESGMYFSSFYPQISIGTSSDTEFTLLTGLMPSSTGTVFVSYADRKYESLSLLLQQKGYYTFSMHGNVADYWNRSIMYNNIGYMKYYAKDSYIIDEEIGLGLSDKSFFRQIIPILNNIKSNNSHFMGTIISLTNHSPFDQVDLYDEFDLTETYEIESEEIGETEVVVSDYLEGSEMGNYLKSAHYADAAFGQLINDLKENGILENTVLVFYGDHEAKLGKNNFNLLYNYDPLTDNIKDEDDPTYISFDNYVYDLYKNTPLVIYNNDNPIKVEITDVMGMYDVFPTIANMFNLDYNYALGNDIFSNREKIVIFPNGNFLTNYVYYNNLKDDYITLTGNPISADYLEKYKNYTDERIDVSNAIIQYDLIRYEGVK